MLLEKELIVALSLPLKPQACTKFRLAILKNYLFLIQAIYSYCAA